MVIAINRDREGCWKAWFRVADEGFSLRHVKIELSVRHPSGDDKQAMRHARLDFRGEV